MHAIYLIGSPVEIDVSTSSQLIQVGHSLTPFSIQQVRIVNDGTATAWIRGGEAGVTVSTTAAQSDTGVRVTSGAIEVQSYKVGGSGDLWIAARAAGATGKIEFCLCAGI